MSGPWEDYQPSQLSAERGPWEDYGGSSPVAAQPQDTSWANVGERALGNIPRSAANIAEGVYQTVRHPIDTATTLGKAVIGAAENVGGGIMNKAVGLFDPELVAFNEANRQDSESQKVANAIGQFYKNRYGSMQGFKESIAEDPLGVVADVATVLTGGGAIASKVPGLQRAGQVAIHAGKAIDPLANTLKVVGKGAELAGKGVANVIGGIGTHTGGKSIQDAFTAGVAGGTKASEFADNLRGNVPVDNIVDQAKLALENMRIQRGSAYRAGMTSVAGNATPIGFQPINQAVNDAGNIGLYRGQVKNAGAVSVQQQIAQKVDEWKNLNPTVYHTPEGMDALKQAIGGIREGTEHGTPARLVADKVYNAVKDQIVKQAPEYAKTMKDYETASDLVKEIQRAFSLGEKSSIDTAMRKLQSLSRNNVSTNYGNRTSLAKELEKAGATNLGSNISAQSLGSWMPRGLPGQLSASATALGGGAMMHPATVPLLAAQSPRLMGEAALGAGRVSGIVGKGASIPLSVLANAGIDPAILANYLYQMQQPKEVR